MKTMMKLVALTLVVMMALCSVALADDKVNTADVYATYAQGTPDVVYNVTLTWGDMNFTVTETPGAWDKDTRTYGDSSYAWAATNTNGDKFYITNSSNTDISVNVDFSLGSDFTMLTGWANYNTERACEDAGNSTFTMLRSLYGGDSYSDAYYEGFLMIDGEPYDASGVNHIGTEKTKIGTITISIAQAENAQITASDYTSR